MNKQIIAALMTVGLCLSAGAANAAGTPFTGNNKITGGVAGACPMLSEDVTVGVSKNVHGAWDCDETLNLVQVAACHEGGSRLVGAACVDLDSVTAGDQLPAGCAAIGGNSTIPDYQAFYASSQGGVMAQYAMGGRCDNARVAGISGFK